MVSHSKAIHYANQQQVALCYVMWSQIHYITSSLQGTANYSPQLFPNKKASLRVSRSLHAWKTCRKTGSAFSQLKWSRIFLHIFCIIFLLLQRLTSTENYLSLHSIWPWTTAVHSTSKSSPSSSQLWCGGTSIYLCMKYCWVHFANK